MAKGKGLSERHRRFVEAYMGEAAGNGARAAELAGFKGTNKVRSETARKLLARKDVKAAMAERIESDPLVATREERQRYWTAVMRGAEKVTIKVRGKMVAVPASIQDRLKASLLLGRAQGDFVERHEHKVTGVVEVVLPDNGRGDRTP